MLDGMCFVSVDDTLREKLRRQTPGLTPRQALDHLGKIQTIDVHLPTTDGRELLLRHRTEPNPEHQLLLTQLKLRLPDQPRPGSPECKKAAPRWGRPCPSSQGQPLIKSASEQNRHRELQKPG